MIFILISRFNHFPRSFTSKILFYLQIVLTPLLGILYLQLHRGNRETIPVIQETRERYLGEMPLFIICLLLHAQLQFCLGRLCSWWIWRHSSTPAKKKWQISCGAVTWDAAKAESFDPFFKKTVGYLRVRGAVERWNILVAPMILFKLYVKFSSKLLNFFD